MLSKLEIEKFNELISFCSIASEEINKQILSNWNTGSKAFLGKECFEKYKKDNPSHFTDKNTPRKKEIAENADEIAENADKDKKTAEDQALKVARLKILEHSLGLITQLLKELGSPYKVKNQNEYRLLSFWDKTYTQHITFYSQNKNLQSIHMINKLYDKEKYDLNTLLNFVVRFNEQANLEQTIKPVNNCYYFMFSACVALLASLSAAFILATMYLTPVVGWVLIPLLALTSFLCAETYYEQYRLFSNTYNPLSKTHSFLDVSPATPNTGFHNLVTNNIRQILGQGTEAVNDSNKVQVNALAEIDLEKIKNDYLSTPLS